MSADRTIGRAVKVKTYQALVELAPDTSSYVKSSYRGPYAIAVINSFVILPVGTERVVAIVTGLDMAEEPELQNKQMLVIARPRRTMWVSMIGTITQQASTKHFEYGVRRYPELDNPVWFASEEDLDIIFDKTTNATTRVTIGKSPIFTDYDVTIDIDRFFGKHAAILGNTGAGKSCTVTALLNAVLKCDVPNAHFLIFDTNNEYEQAFTDPTTKASRANRLVLRNDGDIPQGLIVPHWFMNSSDYHAFFRPGEGAQAPLLFRAIRSARARTVTGTDLRDTLDTIELETNKLENFLTSPPTGNAVGFGKKNVREIVDGLHGHIDVGAEQLPETHDAYSQSLQRLRTTVAADGQLDARASEALRKEVRTIRDTLAKDRLAIASETLIGVDTPAHFDFNDFVTNVFETEIARESQRDARLRSYVGTLQLRLEQARHDPRYAFLFRVAPFKHALASFLRLLLGINPSQHFAADPPPWKDAYEKQYPKAGQTHQVTILDLSELASEVLENVTALLGRLVLEFVQRLPERGSFPLVLVLEEAHRYIPDRAPLERQQRAREVFEKIAKEGRKFGLSLLVASQRPSELSRTVLAQCNSFIVHRIQNPDDQDYFRSVISGINRELLDQLPALAQQQAIVMGDCVTLPLQVRINDVNPRPRSNDPAFLRIWSDTKHEPPDVEAITQRWENPADE